jgi:hypothetical protein
MPLAGVEKVTVSDRCNVTQVSESETLGFHVSIGIKLWKPLVVEMGQTDLETIQKGKYCSGEQCLTDILCRSITTSSEKALQNIVGDLMVISTGVDQDLAFLKNGSTKEGNILTRVRYWFQLLDFLLNLLEFFHSVFSIQLHDAQEDNGKRLTDVSGRQDGEESFEFRIETVLDEFDGVIIVGFIIRIVLGLLSLDSFLQSCNCVVAGVMGDDVHHLVRLSRVGDIRDGVHSVELQMFGNVALEGRQVSKLGKLGWKSRTSGYFTCNNQSARQWPLLTGCLIGTWGRGVQAGPI